MPLGKLNLKTSKKKIEKLLDRVRTRKISVDDLIAFNKWAQVPGSIPTETGAKISGHSRVTGKSLEVATFLSRDQSCWGQQLE
jgi:hypothetical protein